MLQGDNVSEDEIDLPHYTQGEENLDENEDQEEYHAVKKQILPSEKDRCQSLGYPALSSRSCSPSRQGKSEVQKRLKN